MPSVEVDVSATYGEDTASVLSAGFGSGFVPVVASVALYETGPELVHAPALICYGGGAVVPGVASVSVAAAEVSGAGAVVPGAASASADGFTASGESIVSAGAACAGPAETFVNGVGTLGLGAVGASVVVTFAGMGYAALSGARVVAGEVVAEGAGDLSPSAVVLLPKGAPGRVALTAQPTAAVVAWAVPR